jgi:hypothetical protein
MKSRVPPEVCEVFHNGPEIFTRHRNSRPILEAVPPIC